MNACTRLICRPRRAWTAAVRTTAVIAAASVVLLAAACGSMPTQSRSSSSASSSAASVYTQALAYAACIRNHGVPSWPDPNSDGSFDKSQITPQQLGATSARIGAAQTACADLQPNYASGGPTQAEVQQVRAQALRFSQCMRSHGISGFPDPDSNGGLRIPDSVEQTPGYGTALDACKPFPPAPYPPG